LVAQEVVYKFRVKKPCSVNPWRFSSRTGGGGGPEDEPTDLGLPGETAFRQK